MGSYVCLRQNGLVQKGTDLLKMSGANFGCSVYRAVLEQISKNVPRVSWID